MSEKLLMRCTTPMATVLTAIFLIGTCGPQANSTEPIAKNTQVDQDRIQGVWIYVTLTEKQQDRILFSGDRMYFYVGKNTTTGEFALDATKKPKHFDLTFREEKDRTVALQGIYQFLKGDMLFIALAKVDDPRPTDFKRSNLKAGATTLWFVRRAQDIKTGTYTATVNGDGWTLSLDKTGHVTVKKQGRAVVEGIFLATKTELIVFTDQKGPLACKGEEKTGKYKWKLEGKKLSFTKVEDDCQGRIKAMTASAWVRKD